MPRRDVPYPGMICSLKERIAEIADALKTKLHTINGVEGDADGDVLLVSDHPAVLITEDQNQHEIKIGLDNSELPAAAVTSVNGETGAVVLDASEIGSIGGNMQSDINSLIADCFNNNAMISAEIAARGNADSALQTNINTVQAGIPAAAAAAVAADPTVTQLAADVPNKLDKITSGSSLKAYTHTGATQDDTPIVDGTAANSIGMRDANGRMQAANPASGATNNTLATTNWISQTGLTSPNNLIHKSGQENKDGIFGIVGGSASNRLQLISNDRGVEDGVSGGSPGISFYDKNGVRIGILWMRMNGDNTVTLRFDYRKSDGTIVYGSLVQGT